MKSKRIDQKYLDEIDIDAYNTEIAVIDAEWKKENDEAKATGTSVHEYIHNLLTIDAPTAQREYGIPADQYQIAQTEKFMSTEKGIFSEFKMELPLDDDFTLVGIADLIIKDGNHIKIIDFKTDKKIDTKARFDVSKFKTKSLKYPLSKYPDCNLVHYQFQLSLYAYMLQQLNPNLIIDELVIWHIKNMKKCKEYSVSYLKDDVQKLLKWHTKNIKLSQKMKECRRIQY